MPTVIGAQGQEHVIAPGAISYIHVHQGNLGANKKDCGTRPVFTVKNRGKVYWGRRIEVDGRISSAYHPCQPVLDCGAHLVLVTNGTIRLYGSEEA